MYRLAVFSAFDDLFSQSPSVSERRCDTSMQGLRLHVHSQSQELPQFLGQVMAFIMMEVMSTFQD